MINSVMSFGAPAPLTAWERGWLNYVNMTSGRTADDKRHLSDKIMTPHSCTYEGKYLLFEHIVKYSNLS